MEIVRWHVVDKNKFHEENIIIKNTEMKLDDKEPLFDYSMFFSIKTLIFNLNNNFRSFFGRNKHLSLT